MSESNIRAGVIIGAVSLEGLGVGKNPEVAFKIFEQAETVRDPWGIYFLEKCYQEGLGTPKNQQMVVRLDSWMMTNQPGIDVTMSIGADDQHKMRVYERGLLLAHPPTKAVQTCDDSPRARAAHNGQPYCTSTMVTDQDELARKLREVDQKYGQQ